jgi:hypothetical protein
MTLRFGFVAALGVIGLSACDPAPPPNASVSGPTEPEAIPAGETLTDVVREALADVLRDDDAYSRARRLGALLPTLGPELVPAVKQVLKNPTLDLGATEFELLLRYWATHQGEEASRWAVEKSPPIYRFAAVLCSVTAWAEADPQAAEIAAQQWVAQKQHADLRTVLRIALVRGWFAANPSELAQFIRDMDMGLGRQGALSSYIRTVIQTQGIDAVVRWAESVPDDDATYKTAVYRQVAAALPLFDHEAGMRWCEAHCDGPHGNNLRSILARRWVRNDGAAALAWLSNAPEGHEKNLAIRSAFAVWEQLDREAALGWMVAQTIAEPDPWLRPIFPVYTRALAEDSPADAIEWAERIEGAEEREIVLIEVARAWRRVDEAATEAWLLQSSLSEEAREQVRAPHG